MKSNIFITLHRQSLIQFKDCIGLHSTKTGLLSPVTYKTTQSVLLKP